MLISPAYAQAAAPGPGADLFQFVPIIMIFVVFYFLLIRPQQAKAKAHRALIEGIKKGDQIVTAGGIIGKVVRVDADATLLVEIAQNVAVKVQRGTVADLVVKPPPTSNDNKTGTGTPAIGATGATTTKAPGFLDRLMKR